MMSSESRRMTEGCSRTKQTTDRGQLHVTCGPGPGPAAGSVGTLGDRSGRADCCTSPTAVLADSGQGLGPRLCDREGAHTHA